MKLVLLNRDIDFEKRFFEDGDVLKYDGKNEVITEDEVTWSEGKDEVAQKLLAELFNGENSKLKVTLRNERYGRPKLNWSPEGEVCALKLKHVGKENILKNLRDRFHDSVTISISVTMGEEEEPKNTSQYAKTEEITIEEGVHRCKGFVKIYKKEEYGWTTITANIHLSDEEILASSLVFSKNVFEQALLHDVTISAKDGIQIGAHKCFLSASSPVLEAQFGSNWDKEAHSKLDLSDVSGKGVKAFLRYIYYQELEEVKEDPEIACELLFVAHKYEVVPLESWAISHFLEMEDKDLTIGLAFTMYAFVRNIESAKKLQLKTARILNSNAGELENSSQYKDLVHENPEFVTELRKEIANAAKGKGNKRSK